MLDFEVIPEFAIGNNDCKFILGMLFNQAINFIQDNCLTIKGVQILYSDLSPLSMDIVINMSEDGIRLIFDSHNQQLKLIEIYNLSNIKLKYSGKYFCTVDIKPTLEKIDHVFGPTLPGIYDPNQQIFVLNFRGVSFSFSIESNYQPNYAHGMGSLQFNEGHIPTVSKMCIYTGDDIENIKSPPINPISFEGNSYLEKLEVLVNEETNVAYGLDIVYSTQASAIEDPKSEAEKLTYEETILIGDPAQLVQSRLGSPEKVYYKTEDKMEIHKPHSESSTEQDYANTSFTDYFYNYFALGIDILFDGCTHQVKKYILHTNYPGHYDFNIYNRAQFTLPLSIPAHRLTNTQLISSPKNKNNLPVTSIKRITEKAPNISKSFLNDPNIIPPKKIMNVTPFTKWDEISETFSAPFPSTDSSNTTEYCSLKNTSPIVLNRTSSVNNVNPFGSTFCYAYKNIIFEIMGNNHIATVIIFKP